MLTGCWLGIPRTGSAEVYKAWGISDVLLSSLFLWTTTVLEFTKRFAMFYRSVPRNMGLSPIYLLYTGDAAVVFLLLGTKVALPMCILWSYYWGCRQFNNCHLIIKVFLSLETGMAPIFFLSYAVLKFLLYQSICIWFRCRMFSLLLRKYIMNI